MSQIAPTIHLGELASLFGMEARPFRAKAASLPGFPRPLPGFKSPVWSRAAVIHWIDERGGAPRAVVDGEGALDAALTNARAALDANMGRAA